MKMHFQNVFSKYQSNAERYSFTFARCRMSCHEHCIDTKEERINTDECTGKERFK